MALSIERTTIPVFDWYNVSKGGIDNVITALSTEYAQDGFRYWVEISIKDYYDVYVTTTLYVHPNPFGRGIINLRPHLINSVFNRTLIDPNLFYPFIHNTKADSPSASLISAAQNLNTRCRIDIYEAWNVGGVFTQDPDGVGPTQLDLMAYNGWSNSQTTYNNSVASPGKGYNDMTSDTFAEKLKSKVPPSFRSGVIMVPTLPYNVGILTINADDGTYSSVADANNKYVEMKFYDSAGTLLVTDTTSFTIKVEPGAMALLPAYAGNITYLRSGAIPANTTFYTVQLKDAVSNSIASQKYLFVIEEQDCRFDPIPIGWIGKAGGWQYFNFIKKNENSIEIERTEYKKPFGNYGRLGEGIENPGQLTTDWSDNRQYVSRENMVTKYLTITSDWITEKEFEYLESLMVSDVVHWVDYDSRGTYIPMIITDNSYILRKERNSTKYNLTLKLKYAQDYQAIYYNTGL